ncbi:hypothetical protein OR16_27067 [Cupriavidus basilensis OR16]|uniref:Uncharacterized protein n=1 Tax=Cupriavidus basilensis OR16 TaxID=1127483 RepID=H1SB74_9BURK|nr:hypothetical protein [Cupriavidus basilensis]EHP40222.1 hypothetical protein OR16_27067 [Cupriavidus basilensis OR16]
MLVAVIVIVAMVVPVIMAVSGLVSGLVRGLVRVFMCLRMPMIAACLVTERSLVWRCARHGGFPCLFLLTGH